VKLLLLKATAPSQAQLEAGNYAKARMTFQGLPVTIENRAGSMRRGVDRDGKAWAVRMIHHYGYIRGTLGVDGDHLDCYIGPDAEAPMAYLVTTMAPPAFAKVDEQKCMLGFASAAAAKAAFLAHFDNPAFFGSMRAMPMAEFKAKAMTTRERPRMLKALLLLRGA
jgi:hypothetical protein